MTTGINAPDEGLDGSTGLIIPDDVPGLTDRNDPVVVVAAPDALTAELLARANQPPPAAIPFPSAVQLFVPGAGLAYYMIRKVRRRGTWRS